MMIMNHVLYNECYCIIVIWWINFELNQVSDSFDQVDADSPKWRRSVVQ